MATLVTRVVFTRNAAPVRRRSVASAVPVRRVLKNLTHGGSANLDAGTTAFNYLFDGIKDDVDKHLPATDPKETVKALTGLGEAMAEQAPNATSNSKIPVIYTYWGQFVDHDLTANTDRNSDASNIAREDLEPRSPADVVAELQNLREPALNLDSVYGDGPFGEPDNLDEVVPYDGIKLKLGSVDVDSNIPGVRIPPVDDLIRDLPREQGNNDFEKNGVAQIGDGRNDENLIVAQLHVAFLRFHNNAVDWVRKNEPDKDTEEKIFSRARELTRWTYQWIVVYDYLETVTLKNTVDRVLAADNLLRLKERGTYMPLEFSVAAFRFGHSMVRAAYDFNRNFGKDPNALIQTAPLNFLFSFTGKPQASERLRPPQNPRPPPGPGATQLPFNWIIEWNRMVNKEDPDTDRFTRPIDTHIALPLRTLPNEGNDKVTEAFNPMLKKLAVRNLLRGYLLSLPTGQAVVAELGVTPLTQNELEGDDPKIKDALTNGKFLTHTPLWFYILQEAHARAGGNTLGEVGSLIVASTIIGQILHDEDSYLNQDGWTPEKGVTLDDGTTVSTIIDFLKFAKVL